MKTSDIRSQKTKNRQLKQKPVPQNQSKEKSETFFANQITSSLNQKIRKEANPVKNEIKKT
jgi:hypothetical protein